MEFVVDKMKEYVYQINEYYHPDPKKLAHSLLAQDIFSDLTITCGEKEWKVHKNLLWIQSDYFRKLLNGDFKEATSSAIDLSHNDPAALEILIRYFYNFRLPASFASDVSATQLPTLLVQIYAIADKYDVQPLLTLARDQLCGIYSPVFVIANIPAYIYCVRAVDEYTSDEPGSQAGLWGILLHAACANMGRLLKSEEFRELLAGAPEYVVALMELQIVSHDQAWKVSEADEAAARLEDEREGEREGERERLEGGWEVGKMGGPAAWPMN